MVSLFFCVGIIFWNLNGTFLVEILHDFGEKPIQSLKVVTNEKLRGSGSWLVLEDGFGLWRSMSVYFLMLPSSFLRSISVSCL